MEQAGIERVVASDRVFSGRVVTVDVDRVQLDDGSETVREVVRHPGAVVLLPILDDGRILFVRQYRYAVRQQLLELPAGTVEPGEEILSCAARELAEETGHEAGELSELGCFFSTPGFTDELVCGVVARSLRAGSGSLAPDPDERIEVEPLAVAEALARARDGRLRDAKSLAALLLARLGGWI